MSRLGTVLGLSALAMPWSPVRVGTPAVRHNRNIHPLRLAKIMAAQARRSLGHWGGRRRKDRREGLL